MSTVLRGGARSWGRINRDYIATWSEFKVHFKRMYIKDCDKEDPWMDLRRCTQADREPITPCINSLRYIAMHFRHPPGDAQMAKTAYRNLHPSYRRAFGEKTPMCLEDIEDWGIQYEKLRDLDHRWEAPPSADKTHIRSAGCIPEAVCTQGSCGDGLGQVARVGRGLGQDSRRPWSLLGNGRQWAKNIF